ncbi:hypothetical protein OG824_01525 [Streptomyces prunicolor]|uniref:hypothetical protein n=1 Tax=Streptomyces prunicolor TaxID=67348 RepID=UPI00225C098E|nr:hypothetical protein [Streptomyces prunicolor]MCX5233917.1 hypothetical protein [Streptomyces prunicolor]
MDPHGSIARRFPLVARFRPACLPLPDRVQALVDLADRAVQQSEQGLASTVFNQSALLASDLGLPDLARSMCHRHATAYLRSCPLPATSTIRGLEPLVNLARLQIRAGNTDDGRRRLLDLYEAVGTGDEVTFEDITVPADLTLTNQDRHEVRTWLWRVLLADGTRTLTTTGRWREALTHIEEHRGVGTRMLDGRQVAVVAALTVGDTKRAANLLTTTVPGDPWEQAVTDCLTALCCRAAGQDVNVRLPGLVNMYLRHAAKPGLTVFDIRLGLTVLDVIDSVDQPAASLVVEDLVRRTTEARNGYAAREVLAHPLFLALATDSQARECKDLVRACALGARTLPEEAYRDLSAALGRSEAVLNSSVTSTTSRVPFHSREAG